MRNALSEHLNGVVSTNTITRYALHESMSWVIREAKEVVAHNQECALHVEICSTSLRLDLSMIGIGRFLVMRLRSIDFNVVVALGVG